MIANKKKVKSGYARTQATGRAGRQSVPGKSAKRPAVTKQLEEVEAELVKLFRAHWRSVNAKIVRGVDVARQRAHMFFGTNDRERLRAARRYYTPTRSAKLATASDDEILRLSEPWFSAAREQLERWGYDKELRKLVAAEYVALVWDSYDPEDLRKEPAGLVAPLPDESAYYGDVFEITQRFGLILRVCKSVAEPFFKRERREAAAGIEQEFFDNARQSGYEGDEWRVDSSGVNDPRAVDVEINERLPGED
jgi:hypothetical protein